ncbi:LacI family DNA-binding transcriptional regulator [Niveispirillum sp.]|uniref:LacI family DNA-binding transcriptional regulator n=1 Tax=Niveispirillum sp. TaxID=1917217 RepID=UPI001B76B17D|nr:LacI family DNA-binding transcriptional regulator [Niveispirillum sp.]MBP7339785.1 LacI family DNA-binding transcriptional regulator [Niveispirillum sp.]
MDVTISDVAEYAGVSIRTVSRVLNRSPKVNAQTREQVEAAIKTLGFRPSARARGLATGQSFLIGMVHNDRNALVLDEVQRGMVREATRRGYEIVIHPTHTPTEGAVDDVLEFINRSRVDGLVVLSPVSTIDGLPQALAAAGVPAVALSPTALSGYTGLVIFDERAAAADVARHLVALGHTRIALVSGPATAHSARERRTGFISALLERGCTLLGEEEGDYGFNSGALAAARLLNLNPRPTAIFAANDVMAAGVLKAAAARGIAVPRDLSVVGFDGSILAEMLTPSLTTVHRPMGDMAQLATVWLINMAERGEAPVQPVFHQHLTLVPGASSAAAPSGA